MIYPSFPYFDYKIFGGNLSLIVPDKQLVINTINQYSFCVAENDSDFKSALLGSDILLPDGIGVVWSNFFINRKIIQKIAGADLHSYLLTKINQESGKCFYLGSSDEVLKKIKERMLIEYPHIELEMYSPPFAIEFSEADSQNMIQKINLFSPDVLFVGMTAPKQEKWVFHNKTFLNVKIICSIGAVFDFYAGTIKRPNEIMIGLGLEWFGRFLKQPNRMWKRYFYFGPVFLHRTFIHKVNCLSYKVKNIYKSYN